MKPMTSPEEPVRRAGVAIRHGLGGTLVALMVGAYGCSESTEAPAKADPLESYCQIDSAQVEARIDGLLETLSLEQKASLMHGVSILTVDGTWQSTGIPAAGVPGFRMLDGPKGIGGTSTVPIANEAKTTAFPVAIARSATWDRDLERRVGEAIAQEARGVGADTLLAPGMNLAWHPLSGRNQEYYGEDPFLAGEIGTAFVQGVQSRGVIATAKHFTANHVEDTRLEIDAIVDERTLRENFLPQFRKVVQEGNVGAVMSAYNRLNGTFCGENSMLLGEVLKGDWGFAGYVVSDFLWGTHDTLASAEAGLDVEMQLARIYGQPVVDAVESGDLDASNVDEHARRILRAQFCFGLDANPAVADPSQLETDETLALAREVASRAIVLLRNEDETLPLSKTDAASIVLVGPLADAENIGDSRGSSGVRSTEIITIAEALLARDDVTASIEYLPGSLDAPQDREAVANADVVLVAVGLTEEDEGEGQVRPPAMMLGAGDRTTYGLPEAHAAFLDDVLNLSDSVVVVLEGGSAIDLSPWFEQAKAVIMAWYPGLQGGNAIADVLFGDTNPSGRLPVSFPASLDDLQAFPSNALELTYERYHGYQRLDRNGVAPFLPFGFGQSFTTFEFTDLQVREATEDGARFVIARATVTNTGNVAGIETAQVYAGLPGSAVERPVRKLVGFAQSTLEPGEAASIEVRIPIRELAYYEVGTGWRIEGGAYRIEMGPHVADLPLAASVDLGAIDTLTDP